MANLRLEMKKFLADWRDDLDASWQGVLEGAEPALQAIPESLTLDDGEAIFPGRKGKPPAGARSDSHIFRALDGLRPQDVTAVVLGQDPYPKVARATGRSFEQGDLAEWSPSRSKVAESLRRILQVVAHFRSGRPQYLGGDEAWPLVVNDIHSDGLSIAPPRQFFDRWQQQGVLCLNAGLTLSRFEAPVQQAHFALWRPVVQRILTAPATRKDRTVVFLLWGAVAQNTFRELGILEAAEAAGSADRVAVVKHVHPGAENAGGAPRFFEPPNTFELANTKLAAAGASPIAW
jgi:uracil-DNA glycosylase